MACARGQLLECVDDIPFFSGSAQRIPVRGISLEPAGLHPECSQRCKTMSISGLYAQARIEGLKSSPLRSCHVGQDAAVRNDPKVSRRKDAPKLRPTFAPGRLPRPPILFRLEPRWQKRVTAPTDD